MDVQVISAQMLMLFAMMLTGYFVWKKEWFDEASYQKLSKLVVNIFNPLLVIQGVTGKSREGEDGLILQNLGFVLLFFGLLILIGIVFAWILRPGQAKRRLYRLMAIFPNAGFMGIPVITSVLGKDAMIYIVFYLLAYNLLLYTYGILLAQKAAEDAGRALAAEKRSGQWKRMVNSGVAASVLAVMIFACQIALPYPAVRFCEYMGNATIPLSMLLIGMSIAKADLKTVFSDHKMYLFTIMKMLALPVAMAILLKPLHADPVVFGVFILQLAMPVGSIITLLAKESGADETTCTNGIVLTTMASIFTIPFVCMFL